jgi:hypothetical protein
MGDRYPILYKSVSPNDFGEVEANFVDPIEEEFENQLDHYVELIDIAYFDFYTFFMCNKQVACCQFGFNGFSFYVCVKRKSEIF